MKAVNDAYNNISVIKTNNLMIKEDHIKQSVNSNETEMFEFKLEDLDLSHNTEEGLKNKEDKINLSFNDVVVSEKFNKRNEKSGTYRKKSDNKSRINKSDMENVDPVEEALKIIRMEEEKAKSSKGILYNILIDLNKEGNMLEAIELH